jgi:hypothetical protein
MNKEPARLAPIDVSDPKVRAAERTQFDSFMASNTARLLDYARPWLGKMPSVERELLLARALRAAWLRRDKYRPDAEGAGVLKWWGECLTGALMSRPRWRVYRVGFKAPASGQAIDVVSSADFARLNPL